MHPSWKALLADEFKKPYFESLLNFVRKERAEHTVYPPPGEVFTALTETSYDTTKVVILGQDPYHGPGQAHGLSFSVKPAVRILPPTLVNIYKELKTDVDFQPPGHGCLLGWAKQGVLLLNATLTVRAGEPGSHADKGWETLTDSVIKVLSQRETPVVFILWGATARKKKTLIDAVKHSVLESAHPSPLAARGGFFGSQPFSKANEALQAYGIPPVNWQL